MDEQQLNELRRQDRIELEALLTKLNAAKNSLRRDELGDWTIFGKYGTIRACDGQYYIYLTCESSRIWNSRKRELGLVVTQDGDDEGILVLPYLPDANLTVLLRRYVGLHKTLPPPSNAFQPVSAE